jgi:hypothetical protein
MRFVTHPPSVSPPHPIRIKRSKSFVGVVAHVTHRQTAAAFVSRLSRRRFILRLLLCSGVTDSGGCKTEHRRKRQRTRRESAARPVIRPPAKSREIPLFLKKAEPQKQTHFPFTALLLFSGSGLMPQKVWFALQTLALVPSVLSQAAAAAACFCFCCRLRCPLPLRAHNLHRALHVRVAAYHLGQQKPSPFLI